MNRLAVLLVFSSLLTVAGCKSNPSAKIPADVTILPYKAPDIAEITGIDPDAGADEEIPEEPTTEAN